MMVTALVAACSSSDKMQPTDDFQYCNERFADIEMLRYKVDGFENLTLKQKTFIYHLQEAALWGRDILFDQNGRYNLEIRGMLEKLYTEYKGDRKGKDFIAFEEYLKRVWFSNGIHHHYGCEKFTPAFSREWFVENTGCRDEIAEVIFNPEVMAKRVNLAEGDGLGLRPRPDVRGPLHRCPRRGLQLHGKAGGCRCRLPQGLPDPAGVL